MVHSIVISSCTCSWPNSIDMHVCIHRSASRHTHRHIHIQSGLFCVISPRSTSALPAPERFALWLLLLRLLARTPHSEGKNGKRGRERERESTNEKRERELHPFCLSILSSLFASASAAIKLNCQSQRVGQVDRLLFPVFRLSARSALLSTKLHCVSDSYPKRIRVVSVIPGLILSLSASCVCLYVCVCMALVGWKRANHSPLPLWNCFRKEMGGRLVGLFACLICCVSPRHPRRVALVASFY